MDIITEEEWRAVAGFEGSYEVSNIGRVRSLDRIVFRTNGKKVVRQGQIIRFGVAGGRNKKYPHVTLSQNGKPIGRLVHRIVAAAFIPNPLNLPEVNHIDGVKTNNAVSNLEWISTADNKRHAQRLGLYTGSKPKISDDDVGTARQMYASGTRVTDIARSFNVSASLIFMIVGGRHR
jgi:hypothetical protein